MSFESDAALCKFAEAMVDAVNHDEGQRALVAAQAAIDLVQALVKDVNDQADICDKCRGSAVEAAAQVQLNLKTVLQGADGREPGADPMCSGPMACTKCGTLTSASLLAMTPEGLRCPKCPVGVGAKSTCAECRVEHDLDADPAVRLFRATDGRVRCGPCLDKFNDVLMKPSTHPMPSSGCAVCFGKGWIRGVSPGGTRVVKVKCEKCEGSGKR